MSDPFKGPTPDKDVNLDKQANDASPTESISLAAGNLETQKSQAAPSGGLVFDTFFRPGEWVAAGRPVVSLLPPENVKVRAFVPESQVAGIHQGDSVHVTIDGTPASLAGKISFISPQAEYTPPVIYSRENREKLVFLVEVVFDPSIAAGLHPGQPVDVRFTP